MGPLGLLIRSLEFIAAELTEDLLVKVDGEHNRLHCVDVDIQEHIIRESVCLVCPQPPSFGPFLLCIKVLLSNVRVGHDVWFDLQRERMRLCCGGAVRVMTRSNSPCEVVAAQRWVEG